MDPVRKQRRNGILIVIAVLVAVGAWWLLFVPRTSRYRDYKREAQLKAVLQSIQPPAGTKVLDITTLHFIAMSSYLANTEFENVKAHYLKEFTRHGFVYKGEENKPGSQPSLHFCAPHYDAVLSPFQHLKSDTQMMIYTITIIWKDTPC